MNHGIGLALLLSAPLWADGGVIGMAVSQGNFEIDRVAVNGSANLRDRSEITTKSAAGRLSLQNGIRGVLAPGSQAVIQLDRMELRSGEVSVSPGPYRIQAGNYVISSLGSAQAQVQVSGAQVVVAGNGGSVSVADRDGHLLARVLPGRPLALEPTAETSSALVTVGRLQKLGNRFVVEDEITNLQHEVRAPAQELLLARSLGHRVEVSGMRQGDDIIAAERITSAEESPVPDQSGGSKPAKTTVQKAGISHATKMKIILLSSLGAGTATGITLGVMSH